MTTEYDLSPKYGFAKILPKPNIPRAVICVYYKWQKEHINCMIGSKYT